MLPFCFKQFRTDSPFTSTLDGLDFRWYVIQKPITFLLSGRRFSLKYNSVPKSSKNLHYRQFIVSTSYSIGPNLLIELVQHVHSTNSARLFVERNF